MEPMQKVATLAELRADRGLKVEIGETKILLVRDGDAVRAYQAECPHAKGPLEEGAICNGRIVCPWHKGTFAASDGALIEPPALQSLARYPVRVEGEDILVSPQRIAPANQPTPPKGEDARVMLVVGGGAGGAAAVAALREFGFGGRIVLVGREPGPPFDRTALSKFVTAGQMKPDEVPPLLPDGFFAEQGVERMDGEVVRLEATQRRAWLRSGREIAFEAALLVTGSIPKSPDIAGATLPNVHLLRTRQDAAAILADLRPGARAVILGSSFIGLEVASGLREQDVDVTVVSPEKVPFARQFGARIGASLQTMHEAAGVKFVLGSRAAELCGQARVEAVLLEDGRRLPADLVVVGLGVRPVTDLIDVVERADDGGLVVDAGMRVAPRVYAAGDIAQFAVPDGSRRIEHWRVAQQQARVAARNMLGGDAVYDGVPFFWTYQGGKRFEYLGHAETWDDTIVEGDLDSKKFVALLARGGMVAAVVACDRERETAMLAERMRQPLPVDEALQVIRSV